jgi:hypothetical protein
VKCHPKLQVRFILSAKEVSRQASSLFSPCHYFNLFFFLPDISSVDGSWRAWPQQPFQQFFDMFTSSPSNRYNTVFTAWSDRSSFAHCCKKSEVSTGSDAASGFGGRAATLRFSFSTEYVKSKLKKREIKQEISRQTHLVWPVFPYKERKQPLA